jgi:hypothetical protein
MINPERWLWVATGLLTVGAVLPFLIVIKVVENALWLSFVSYAASVCGLFLGMIALAGTVGKQRRRDEDDQLRV